MKWSLQTSGLLCTTVSLSEEPATIATRKKKSQKRLGRNRKTSANESICSTLSWPRSKVGLLSTWVKRPAGMQWLYLKKEILKNNKEKNNGRLLLCCCQENDTVAKGWVQHKHIWLFPIYSMSQNFRAKANRIVVFTLVTLLQLRSHL